MKVNLFKFTLLFTFSSLLLLPTIATAQSNEQYEITGVTTKGSLILEYLDRVEIVYNSNSSNAFLHVDRNSLIATEATVPNLDEVYDMELKGDVVCFCGKMNGMQGLGWFDINDLFFSSGQVEFLPLSLSPVVGGYTGNLTLRKLEIYAPSPTDVHVFVLGDMVFNGGVLAPDQTYLFNFYYNGTWRIEYVYEVGGVYWFDDLAVTSSFLMVVGHKYNGGDYSHIAANLFPLTFQLLYYNIPPVQMFNSEYSDYFPLSRPLIDAWCNDSYIVASHGMYEMNPGVVYSYYTAPGSLIKRWMVPNVTTTSEFRDLKWKCVPDSEEELIYMVPDHNNTVVYDEIYVSDIGNNVGTLKPRKMTTLHSLDNILEYDGAIVSGQTQSGYLGVWEAVYIDNNCADITPLTIKDNVHDVLPWVLPLTKENTTSTQLTYFANINSYPIVQICE